MKLKNIFISENYSIKDALKRLDKTAEKVLLIVNEHNKLLGTVTDGDIRRHIIKTGRIEGFVKDIYNKNPIFIYNDDFSENLAKKILVEKKIEVLPILNKNNVVVDFITWTSIFGNDKSKKIYSKMAGNIPVIIMAGGKGTRLDPFTKVLPKPLIPIDEKPVIEHIIDRFREQGTKKFYLTLNYKGEMIAAYFNGIEKDYEIEFVWEDDFWGTAGSLKLLEHKISENFIVSNCDIMIRANFSKILDFHIQNSSYLTLISSIQHYKIPYGVVKFKDGGEIEEIIEKPEYVFPINTGVYILNKKVLSYIPEKKYYDMPNLINKVLMEGNKAFSYPIGESDYIDIGQWNEYREAINKLSII
ncbi:NTP transferase domain-containing protein [Desulfohalobiaceae bacterium Ax17]|uniref:sugar phosphate nucleotidyltransferase n=1 Tax=Desulfovulcanus ferrireducens TaxID=2831190 RepID=UPI00207BCB3A|nr:sugar phosphate nucleotidyltransferase [Desulfovulcanus ferrireducens]MBT8763518.1 NTP transferase domain-containing protein [Desulfovulcanus ferrireducens]